MSLFKVLVAAVPVFLAGCGFHLQGPPAMPPQMQRTYIDTADRHSIFYQYLRRELLAAGVDVVDTESSSTAVFTISIDDTDQRVLSVSARNVPTEYEVFYTIEYALISGTETLLAMQDLTLTSDYTYDSTLVLGKAKEEQALREAIARDLVRVVLKQISTQ
ncbi:MAG: hypothetical protein HKN77_10215 [Woeseiaceae bacterium]|nr:hypothetical protein [Woeseiaceae bacterium]